MKTRKKQKRLKDIILQGAIKKTSIFLSQYWKLIIG